jgi:hypothetical protein
MAQFYGHESRFAECHFAECHFAECHFADCRGTNGTKPSECRFTNHFKKPNFAVKANSEAIWRVKHIHFNNIIKLAVKVGEKQKGNLKLLIRSELINYS